MSKITASFFFLLPVFVYVGLFVEADIHCFIYVYIYILIYTALFLAGLQINWFNANSRKING